MRLEDASLGSASWSKWYWVFTVLYTFRCSVIIAPMKPAKNTICLWYDGDAEEAARFYARTFPDSAVGAVHRAPGDFPSGKEGMC